MNRLFSGSGKAEFKEAAVGDIAKGNQLSEPFEADRKDTILALFAFVLGFFFIRWVLLSWRGWGVSVFTAAYCYAVTLYLLKKGIHITKTGYFWLSAVLVTGASYSIYANNGLEPWRSLFLFCSAVYLVVNAAGRQIMGITSNWLLLDGINGMFVIPFKNFWCQYKSLSIHKYVRRSMGSKVLSIAAGILLSLLVATIVLPLLMQADSGGFARIAAGIYKYFQWIQDQIKDTMFEMILAIPVAAYLFGLIAGCAHDRGCRTFGREGLQEAAEAARLLAPSTVYTVLGTISCLYLVFIGSQLPYFFSAFAGQRPEGWQIYSEYARRGFFELCQIAAINLTLLAAVNLLCKKPQRGNLILKTFNCILSLLTILLIATAFSKMALYIGAYGLSIRRLLPCFFMVFLTVVCGGVIALQRWQFSIMRLSITTAALMMCALCLLGPDGYVVRYNAARYLSGTLQSFDVSILHQSGPAGVEAALKVHERTTDEGLKQQLNEYILDQKQDTGSALGKAEDSLQNLLVRRMTAGF